ncbi:ABC transporter ATP-binding protein [Glaciibacter superstes]|uniref:ABC transporter ATP-binding protein n=1 Tax=Glaciibacter superstes TaxID=501023 RepID=UPI0003B468E3|nr:ABC transporter ATP-binding protein [Glaciibacter superstes]
MNLFRTPSTTSLPRTPVVDSDVPLLDVPLLDVKGLDVGYGDHRVVAEVSLCLAAGDSLAVIGTNGSGKSTLLRSIAGLLPALGGTMHLNGAGVDERSATFRASVATVFDDDAYFPGLSVGEHLMLVATAHSVTSPATAVAAELDFFGLTEAEGSLPSNLSSGQRRRMLLAAAFIRPSDLLVLDEPEQRLDTVMRSRLRDRIRTLVDGGNAVVFATHDPAFVTQCGDAALLIGNSARSDSARRLTPAAGAAEMEAL